MFTGTRDGPEACATFCNPEIGTGFVGFATKNLSGTCACYFDDGTMPATLPAGASSESDRTSVGPVTGGSGDITEECFPYLVRSLLFLL